MPSAPATHSDRTPAARRWWRGELVQLLGILALMVVARSSFANHYVVPSGSMEDTLQVGDRVVVDMRAYGWRLPLAGTRIGGEGVPRRGDIAVFDSPEDGTRLIKRVAAVAGDRVDLRAGHLWINGQPLQQAPGDGERFGTHAAQVLLDMGGGPDIHGLVVPAGRVLMLGDHRGNSHDSRWFGLVPAQSLYGRAMAVYWRSGEGLEWRRL